VYLVAETPWSRSKGLMLARYPSIGLGWFLGILEDTGEYLALSFGAGVGDARRSHYPLGGIVGYPLYGHLPVENLGSSLRTGQWWCVM
jgi:hypothetical protein